ncbi:hypothetical protein H1W37_18100 [Stappia taiwanensis]|uniref:Uncharacterized protein n=1 Tax=Stappia taiwanensis TaxID=992267 RepID=A0A838XT25_9HYPH|nr:hypothetical protein [Stappia taiwanensis]MBA4613575.1 hypothetical protein [Stappia taiwanensis]GGE99061.1 hypothetical protein GCM10007285_28300 [Stappia taiwanensis]
MADAYLQKLIWRFPRLEHSILALHRDDPDFRSICEELAIADTARERWKDLPERADEYEKIFERLQDEFLDHLDRKMRAAFVEPFKQRMKDDGRNT